MSRAGPDEPGARKSARHRFRLAGVVAVLLGGLYAAFWLHHADRPRPPLDRTVTFALAVTTPGLGVPLPTFSVHQGDKVVMLIRSDVAGEFHLHGYDREIPLKPGDWATLAFDAGMSGQFPIELHEGGGSERQIARLVVQPE